MRQTANAIPALGPSFMKRKLRYIWSEVPMRCICTTIRSGEGGGKPLVQLRRDNAHEYFYSS